MSIGDHDFTFANQTLGPTPDITIPLYLRFSVTLKRLPRAACQTCGRRRVLFVLAVEPEGPNGLALCAICAGVR